MKLKSTLKLIPVIFLLTSRCYSTRYFEFGEMENKITDLNTSLATAQNQIHGLETSLQSTSRNFQLNLNNLAGILASITYKLNNFYNLMETLQGEINTVGENLEEAVGNIAVLTEQIASLQEYNSLWQQNFLIVNKTFEQLQSTKIGCCLGKHF